MNRPRFTRVEFYGKRFETPLWVVGILGANGLFLYGLYGFQWLNQRDPDFIRLAFVTYLISLIFLFVRRKKFFPWASKAPTLAIVGSIALAVPFAFAIFGGILASNALLDRSSATSRQYVIIRKTGLADAVLVPIEPGGPEEVELHVGKPGAQLYRGNVVELVIKQGLFKKAWVKDYRLVRNSM
jgi:hypothetical protein